MKAAPHTVRSVLVVATFVWLAGCSLRFVSSLRLPQSAGSGPHLRPAEGAGALGGAGPSLLTCVGFLSSLLAGSVLARRQLRRRVTRSVKIGSAVTVGSEHPLALQTMTTCPTSKPELVEAQIARCAAAGLDVVRVTVQGLKEAKALARLSRPEGSPGLVADIHFSPSVAVAVADNVDKVRINPGNFVKSGSDWREEMRRQLQPLLKKLKTSDKTLRIGVNHGSLSERILQEHGDTPQGMVASALEVIELCREFDFHNLVISMKSSNVKVMIAAYRHLVDQLALRDWPYPLHLGVTEAGSGADGRIKSAVGIGTLLIDGIGDTIRVSLTEDPWLEAPSCKALKLIHYQFMHSETPTIDRAFRSVDFPAKRECLVHDTPLHRQASVLVAVKQEDLGISEEADAVVFRELLGLRRDESGNWTKTDESADAAIVDQWHPVFQKLLDVNVAVVVRSPGGASAPPAGVTVCLSAAAAAAAAPAERGFGVMLDGSESDEIVAQLAGKKEVKFFILRPPQFSGAPYVNAGRRIGDLLNARGATQPLLLDFETSETDDWELDLMYGAVLMGSLLVDNLAQGVIWQKRRLDSLSLLQACRLRASKTEFISCPSCGRTLFDLQQTTERIKQRTGHLPGVRIAVMGCIVNGPGEMADADFGFVGSLPGKVDLYRGKTCVRRGVDFADADEVLVQLIKDHGLWKDPLPAE